MAEPREARLSWSRFQALPSDVLHAIVALLSLDDRKALRLAQRRARELVNGAVASAHISCIDVVDKLALHRCFPNLAHLTIFQGWPSDASFAEFAAATLQHLTSLTSLDLWGCCELGVPEVSALAASAPQLQALVLPGDGRRLELRSRPAHDLLRADIRLPTCCVLTLGCRPAARRLHRRQRLPEAALPLPSDGAARSGQRRVLGPAAPEQPQRPARADSR
jgi:hypothetical protein